MSRPPPLPPPPPPLVVDLECRGLACPATDGVTYCYAVVEVTYTGSRPIPLSFFSARIDSGRIVGNPNTILEPGLPSLIPIAHTCGTCQVAFTLAAPDNSFGFDATIEGVPGSQCGSGFEPVCGLDQCGGLLALSGQTFAANSLPDSAPNRNPVVSPTLSPVRVPVQVPVANSSSPTLVPNTRGTPTPTASTSTLTTQPQITVVGVASPNVPSKSANDSRDSSDNPSASAPAQTPVGLIIGLVLLVLCINIAAWYLCRYRPAKSIGNRRVYSLQSATGGNGESRNGKRVLNPRTLFSSNFSRSVHTDQSGTYVLNPEATTTRMSMSSTPLDVGPSALGGLTDTTSTPHAAQSQPNDFSLAVNGTPTPNPAASSSLSITDDPDEQLQALTNLNANQHAGISATQHAPLAPPSTSEKLTLPRIHTHPPTSYAQETAAPPSAAITDPSVIRKLSPLDLTRTTTRSTLPPPYSSPVASASKMEPDGGLEGDADREKESQGEDMLTVLVLE